MSGGRRFFGCGLLICGLLLGGRVVQGEGVGILSLSGQEALELIVGQGSRLSEIEDEGVQVMRVQGVGSYRSKDKLDVSAGRIYRLSGKFRAADGTEPARLYLGFMPLDADGRAIESGSVWTMPGTETGLAIEARPGQKELLVKDAHAWKIGELFPVAFDVKNDFSDLPNRSIFSSVARIEKTPDENYRIELESPLKTGHPAGTAVRQHRHASTYAYSAAGNAPLSSEWQEFGGIIRGVAKHGAPFHQWWPGTRRAAIIILFNAGGDADSATLMKDVRLEELTR